MITTNYAGNAFSQDFIDAVNAQMVEYDAKLYDNGSPVDCSIMRMELTLGGCSESDEGFQIGEVYASSMTATLHGLSGSLTGHELDVLIGVNTGSAFEYAQVATVVVTSSKAKGGFVSIQAAGKLAYACTNVPIGASGELTPSEVAAAILAASGIPVTIGAFQSTTTVTITADMTCRAALAATAKRLGGYACETNAGGAAIMPFSSTSTYTLDPDDMTRYPDLEEADYTVDGITVQAAEEAYTFGTGRVVIADANATATTAAVTWGNVSGYAFRQGSANTAILDPRVTPFDVLTIGTATMPARGISATYDGGYFGVFSALGLTDAGESAHFKGAIAEQVDAAEKAAREALDVAEATGQHFWPYDDGAHVTGPETEDEFLAAQAAGFPDLSDIKPYHNLLMNSLGILLRSALNNLVSITRSAIAFFDGLGNGSANVVASFGANGFQVGISNKSHLVGDYHSLQLVDKEGDTYFHVSDLRNTSGTLDVTDVIVAGAGQINFPMTLPPVSTDYTVTVSDGSGGTPVKSQGNVVIMPAPNEGATVTIEYTTDSQLAKAYTLGVRGTGNVGAMSTAIGNGVVASGIGSCAEGNETTASGMYAHAEGDGTLAAGSYSHAEGNHTQARPRTAGSLGSGGGAHAEGSYTVAAGHNSHAQNLGTIAASNSQTALGKYNVEDSSDNYAVIVGNGTGNFARSNLLTVGWSGPVVLSADGSPLYSIKDTGADLSKANNNISSGHWPGFAVYDNANRVAARLEAAINPNGSNGFQLYARNYDTSGASVGQAIISGSVDKTGAVSYSIGNVAAFLRAIGLSVVAGNWTPVSTYTDSVLALRRQGSVVFVTGAFNLKSAVTGRTKIATLPSGFAPYSQSYARTTDSNGGVGIVINANGDFNVEAATSGNHWFSAMWITA